MSIIENLVPDHSSMFFGVTLEHTTIPCTPRLPVSFSSLSSVVNGNPILDVTMLAESDERESNTDVVSIICQKV